MKNVGNKLKENKKGFTIIEVVLVLAIAGLIFLIVFLAVPALQRNRRDTQRRSDVSRFVAQLENYASNNNGAYPSLADANGSFKNDYLDANNGGFNDPSTGNPYTVSNALDGNANIRYGTGLRCSSDALGVQSAPGVRNVAAIIDLESGSYCQDNQ